MTHPPRTIDAELVFSRSWYRFLTALPFFSLLLSALLMVAGCASPVPPHPDSLSPLVLFQDVGGKKPPAAPVQKKPAGSRATGNARDQAGKGEKTLPEYASDVMVVTASRVAEDPLEIPRSLTVVDPVEIRGKNSLSIVDSLDDRIGVWVEKRTSTTSDPVVRGLAGGNLVALMDGNTISTFWGEGGFAGDDMYGKIDANMVERIEVLRGPASVQYGSNALGGVLNFITRSSPIDYTSEGIRLGGRVKGTYGSAAKEWRLRTEVFGATPEFKFLAGYTNNDVNDVQGGRGVGVQDPTGGEDENFDGKFQWRATDNSEATFSVQNVHRSHLKRFYRPTQDNQNFRQGYSATYRIENPTPFWDEVKANLYYQYKDDRRYWANGDRGRARWWTYTGDLQMVTHLGKNNRLTYGVGAHRDYGESPDDEQFTMFYTTGVKEKASPDTVWDNAGIFLMDRWQVLDCLTLTGGLRYDYFRFDADPDEHYMPPSGRPDLDDFTDRESSFTGGLGFVVEVDPAVRVFGNYSRGFRQFPPHFGVTQHAWGVLASSQLLDPITADNFEVGTKWRTEACQGSAAVYYTKFDNFQNIVRGTFMGQDWFDFNNDTIRQPDEDVYVTKGNGDAYVYGVEIETEVSLQSLFRDVFGPEWTVGGGFMWNFGRDITRDEPFRHTHPARGLFKIRWDDTDPKRGLWWEFTADMVRHFDRIQASRQATDPTYRNDPQNPASGHIRRDGLPGYTVYDIRGGININEYASVTLAVENLTDKKYRSAHSRWDASGINFVASLDIHYY